MYQALKPVTRNLTGFQFHRGYKYIASRPSTDMKQRSLPAYNRALSPGGLCGYIGTHFFSYIFTCCTGNSLVSNLSTSGTDFGNKAMRFDVFSYYEKISFVPHIWLTYQRRRLQHTPYMIGEIGLLGEGVHWPSSLITKLKIQRYELDLSVKEVGGSLTDFITYVLS